jgi:hypothetical protein
MIRRCEDCRHFQHARYCMAPIPVWVTVMLAAQQTSRMDACAAVEGLAVNCDAYHARREAWLPPVRSVP